MTLLSVSDGEAFLGGHGLLLLPQRLAQLLAPSVDLLVLVAVEGGFAAEEVVGPSTLHLKVASASEVEGAELLLLAIKDLLYWLENDLALLDCAIGCLLL